MEKERFKSNHNAIKSYPLQQMILTWVIICLKLKFAKDPQVILFPDATQSPFLIWCWLLWEWLHFYWDQHSKTISGLCCNVGKTSPALLTLERPRVLPMVLLWTSDLKSLKDTQQTSWVFPALADPLGREVQSYRPYRKVQGDQVRIWRQHLALPRGHQERFTWSLIEIKLSRIIWL